MNFMENLRVLREKNNMTQEQLAERMEVSRQTVSKWEGGTSMPEMEKLVQLTEMFGCTMDGLLKGNRGVYQPFIPWGKRPALYAWGIAGSSFMDQDRHVILSFS